MSSNKIIEIEGCIVRKRKRRECIVLGLFVDDASTKSSDHRNQQLPLPATNIMVPYDHPSLSLCFLNAIVRIEANVVIGQEGNQGFVAHEIHLVQCAPDPRAVEIVIQGILDGSQPEWTLPVLTRAQIQEIHLACTTGNILIDSSSRHSITPQTKFPKQDIAKIVRMLKWGSAERDPRQRRPHTKRCDLELLDCVESNVKSLLRDIQGSVGPYKRTTTTACSLPLHLDLDHISRGLTRQEYLIEKKYPQVQWMCRRVQQLSHVPNHILDVGGGQGDLTFHLAQEFPSSRITIVDTNDSSLTAGHRHMETTMANLASRITFVHADFHQFTLDPSRFLDGSAAPHPIDLVVALHACGDLSDLALHFAKSLEVPFVICPCCYTKRAITEFEPGWYRYLSWTKNPTVDISVMCRLAELNERPNESKRARQIINSLRLNSFVGEKFWTLSLEEYDMQSSLRNMVLIGETDDYHQPCSPLI